MAPLSRSAFTHRRLCSVLLMLLVILAALLLGAPPAAARAAQQHTRLAAFAATGRNLRTWLEPGAGANKKTRRVLHQTLRV